MLSVWVMIGGVLVSVIVGVCMLAAVGISRGEDASQIDSMTKVVCTLSGVCCMLLLFINSMGNSYDEDVDVDVLAFQSELKEREAIYVVSLDKLEDKAVSLRNTIKIRDHSISSLESDMAKLELKTAAKVRAANLSCLPSPTTGEVE